MELLKQIDEKLMIEVEIVCFDLTNSEETIELGVGGTAFWINKNTAVALGIISTAVTVKCPKCKGTGDLEAFCDCDMCDGTGRIEAEVV
tara:strand:- start:53068 stop:53334 length:267 start_codon:yes stop_codon:yes gene_type:complete